MKKAVMTAPGKLELWDVDKPVPGEDEVLVKIQSVGICTWERKYYRGVEGAYPFVGGHEIFGIVEKAGDKVAQPLVQGDTVVVASLTRCGECYFCRRGLDNMCENVGSESKPGGMWGPGGFSEYMTVKNYEVFKVSGNVDPAVATLAEPIACVIRSVERGALEIGDSALVIGGGVMGLIHTILAKKQGNRVFLSEPDAMRRKMAEQLGADIVIDPTKDNVAEIVREHTEGRGCEAVFFTAGGVSAIQTGIASLVKNGRMVIYGATGSEHELILDPAVFHYDEIYLTGVTKHTKDSFRKAAAMLSENSELFTGLISERYPFSDIRHAFERSELMDTFRVVLDM